MISSSLDALRYPIGKFVRPSELDPAARTACIATLASLPGVLRSVVTDWTEWQLETPYRPEGWTVRQLIHHVADSHLNTYARVRLALTEDWPTVKDYAEQDWARLTDARTAPVGLSLDLLAALHGRWVLLLESLKLEDWTRGYVHSVSGRQNLDQVLALYDWHGRHHLAHITGLKDREGW